MAWDNSKQFRAHANQVFIEHGEVAFATTSTTVEVSTNLSRIFTALVTAKSMTSGVTESFYCDRTITSGAVTITRQVTPIILGSNVSTDVIASNDVVGAAIGICPVAGTLNEAWHYNKTKQSGGTVLLNIGKIASNGTGAADVDYFLAAAQAEATPATGKGKAITTFAATDVAEDDLLTWQTADGTGSNPTGSFVQVKITPTPTSALIVNYTFWGLY